MNRGMTKANSNTLNPWSVLKNDVWDLLDQFTKDLDLPSTTQDIVPKIEVKDTGTSYKVCAEVPGMDQKDINITLKENKLIIEGEKKNETKKEDKSKGVYHSEFSYGHFYRAIPLSDDVEPDKVTATYRNGVLEVELGKHPEKMNRSRKIEINAPGTQANQVETKH